MKRLLTTSTIVVGALIFAGPHAKASIIDFGLNLGGGDVGVQHNFVQGLLTLGSRAEGSDAGDLYLKRDPIDTTERGLGLTGDPTGDDEIFALKKNGKAANDFVELDFTGLLSKITTAGVLFGVNSVQSNESWALYGSNTEGVLGTLIDHGDSSDLTASLPDVGQFDFYDFVATNANFLITDITVTPNAAVPEPASLALLGLGLAGTLAAARRKAR